jgi:hypothetical protein
LLHNKSKPTLLSAVVTTRHDREEVLLSMQNMTRGALCFVIKEGLIEIFTTNWICNTQFHNWNCVIVFHSVIYFILRGQYRLSEDFEFEIRVSK